MKRRCSNKGQPNYARYGGIGVKVCDRWEKFLNFKEDMLETYLAHVSQFGEKNTTIDRIDTSKGYSKENCKWSTYSQQRINQKRTNLISFRGRNMSAYEWSRELGFTPNLVNLRLWRGWSIEKALTEPAKK